jgi:hypothetical protein
MENPGEHKMKHKSKQFKFRVYATGGSGCYYIPADNAKEAEAIAQRKWKCPSVLIKEKK